MSGIAALLLMYLNEEASFVFFLSQFNLALKRNKVYKINYVMKYKVDEKIDINSVKFYVLMQDFYVCMYVSLIVNGLNPGVSVVCTV